VLQERVFERLGGTLQIKADARVIAASNRALADEVRKNASGRPVLPDQRVSDYAAAAPRQDRRHPPACAVFLRALLAAIGVRLLSALIPMRL